MKITIISTSASGQITRTLVAQEGRDKPLINPSLVPERASEVQEFFRASNARVNDRGNLRYTLSFSTQYQMLTEVKAQIEVLTLESRTPAQADIEIDCSSDVERQVRIMRDALIKITELHCSGIRVYVGYQIIASDISIP